MPHKSYIHKPTVIKDLCIIAIINFLFLLIFTQVDLLEKLYFLSRDYEEYEIDEIFSVAITISISLLVFSYRRIKELGLMARTLEQMSLVDPLSGLPNRRAGQISLIAWCELAEKQQRLFSVYQIDLDRFKRVNDFYGQVVGDEVIQLVSQRINNVIPDSAQLFRWLDDNFLVVVPNNDILSPNEFAIELQECINNKIMPTSLDLTCSIGYSVWQSKQNVNDVLHNTEDAINLAKQKGVSNIQVAH